jgi:hypothetical protein
MKRSALICILSSFFLTSCNSSPKQPAKKTARNPVPIPALPAKQDSGDVAFQSVVSRLRSAVASKDLATLAALMPSDFGHRWDQPPTGESPFDYWDQHKLWAELLRVINTRWSPHDGFMVAPPQFATDPNYKGYRAGISMIDGGWKFAYFVPPPPANTNEPAPEEAPLPPLPSVSPDSF